MGKKRSAAQLREAKVPMTNNELTAYNAEDSTSMVMMAFYSPPVPTRPLAGVRESLLCRASRMMIMRVRRTLSEIETEKYGMLKRIVIVSQGLVSSLEVR